MELSAWNMQFKSYKEIKGWLDWKESLLKLKTGNFYLPEEGVSALASETNSWSLQNVWKIKEKKFKAFRDNFYFHCKIQLCLNTTLCCTLCNL